MDYIGFSIFVSKVLFSNFYFENESKIEIIAILLVLLILKRN